MNRTSSNYSQKKQYDEPRPEFLEDLKNPNKNSIEVVKKHAGINFLNFVDERRDLKTVWRDVPFDTTLGLCDISCKDKAKEDGMF